MRRAGSSARSPAGEQRRRGRRGPPAERPAAGHQLGEVERLGQVVVGAAGQPVDLVGQRCRWRSASAPGSSTPEATISRAQLVAGHARQVAVEHDHVVAGDRRPSRARCRRRRRRRRPCPRGAARGRRRRPARCSSSTTSTRISAPAPRAETGQPSGSKPSRPRVSPAGPTMSRRHAAGTRQRRRPLGDPPGDVLRGQPDGGQHVGRGCRARGTRCGSAEVAQRHVALGGPQRVATAPSRTRRAGRRPRR